MGNIMDYIIIKLFFIIFYQNSRRGIFFFFFQIETFSKLNFKQIPSIYYTCSMQNAAFMNL
jgi:hypothetical protein